MGVRRVVLPWIIIKREEKLEAWEASGSEAGAEGDRASAPI